VTHSTATKARATWKRRLLRGAVIYVLAPYVAIVLVFVLFQRSLIYVPTKSGPLVAVDRDFQPHTVEQVLVKADDEVELHGWLIHSATPSPGTRNEPARSLVIYFPGNAGHRAMRRPDLVEVADSGVDVLIVDYRGYAENGGSPSEASFVSDARNVWKLATGHFGYPPERIAVFGESLGGAVAIRLCADLCCSGTPPGALIVTSTFTSLGDMAAWLYPAFPFRFLVWDRFDSLARMKDVNCPVTVIHGDADELIPWQQGRRLLEAAPETSASLVPKRWVQVAGMGHNDVPIQLLREALGKTFQEQVDPPRP
jgi:uncharacterized protein